MTNIFVHHFTHADDQWQLLRIGTDIYHFSHVLAQGNCSTSKPFLHLNNWRTGFSSVIRTFVSDRNCHHRRFFQLSPGVLTQSRTPRLDDSSCWSFEHVVSCPASGRREKLQSDWGWKHLQILPHLDPLPSELSSWHLTVRAANRPLERHWHSFCVAQDWICYSHCQFCNTQLFI